MIAIARRPVREPREPREYVDFAKVPPSQWKMHDRLENWAKAQRGPQKQSGVAAQPMFGLYRATEAKSVERMYGMETAVPVNHQDAALLGMSINELPEKHRRAVHWYYLRGRAPASFALQIMVPIARLAELVVEARAKLIDMGR